MRLGVKGLDKLKNKFTSYNSNKDEWAVVERAYEYALAAHAGQRRESGESYITHPLEVSIILAELELDLVTIVAGLLHDVVEDTEITLEQIEKDFGPEVALLIDGVTKLSSFEFTSKEEHQAENLRKMFLAMAKDIRVILIKLADRTHNMRTLGYLRSSKQKEISKETLEIYAPLAHRLGIYKLKSELEDHAFRYLQRDDYYRLDSMLAKKRNEREELIEEIIAILKEKLFSTGIEAEIQGRPKNLYSIYTKMKEQKKDIDEIYDLTAVRIIVDSVKDCYAALGVVHTIWKPIPGRFFDYIAMPKPNMYQSLHTTVVGAKNELVEVQIRTWEMHRTAEYGIAAHWRYKEGVKDEKEFAEKLSWLRQLLEWQQEYSDVHEFIENLKIDLFTDEVFVFTPKGDVVDLPAGAIPIDFAYRIHTDIGHRCNGAKINGRIVSLDYKLKTGDIVEIFTSKQGRPSRDWLNMVKSSQAKSKIRAWFKKERREENIVKGKELLEKELRKLKIAPHLLLKRSLLEEVEKKFSLQTEDDLYAAVGYGGITPQQVIARLREEYYKHRERPQEEIARPEVKPWKKKNGAYRGVRVEGVDNILIRFAKCCNPVPGDDIVGFVTRGRGVSVHRSDCPNLKNQNDRSRLLNVFWEENREGAYPVEIEISAIDRTNLLTEIMAVISENKVDISAVNGRTDKDGIAKIHLTLIVKNLKHLEFVMNKVKHIKSVFEVHRFFSN
ncbi:MAG: RelA/SpoT family protein [Dethiobacteria bacterium]|jgi:guanosine-3',5'-bis(diphosphate) 3'-pyrophosphohydrolase|nr:bifunctional (p)ppGpp synthetase/guanosine-3',5'-bis(diphosphate) 3'-pyrophosphohydrolase [Bacillota bacterium]